MQPPSRQSGTAAAAAAADRAIFAVATATIASYSAPTNSNSTDDGHLKENERFSECFNMAARSPLPPTHHTHALLRERGLAFFCYNLSLQEKSILFVCLFLFLFVTDFIADTDRAKKSKQNTLLFMLCKGYCQKSAISFTESRRCATLSKLGTRGGANPYS